MTLRKNTAASLGPEEIAGMVPATALEMFPPDDYRAYFQALTEEVEDLTGSYDTGLTLRAAEVLGISPVDWFKLHLGVR